jgi:uncharacterized protein YkwD
VGLVRIGPIVLVFLAAAHSGVAQADEPNPAEWQVLALANAARESLGRPPLQLHADLVRAARVQTVRMARAGGLFHTENASLQAITPSWTRLAENVGMGASVERIHATFLASPSHAANLLGDFNCVGVGAGRDPEGRLFVTVIFAKIPSEPVVQATTLQSVRQPR